MAKKIGYAMLAAPFVALAVGMCLTIGASKMLLVFIGCAVLLLWIVVAVHLAMGEVV